MSTFVLVQGVASCCLKACEEGDLKLVHMLFHESLQMKSEIDGQPNSSEMAHCSEYNKQDHAAEVVSLMVFCGHTFVHAVPDCHITSQMYSLFPDP
jgi:hypothetical protein